MHSEHLELHHHVFSEAAQCGYFHILEWMRSYGPDVLSDRPTSVILTRTLAYKNISNLPDVVVPAPEDARLMVEWVTTHYPEVVIV